jgi:uncharacterized protein YdeI (YjbR/CyaY-like superfamily)
MNTRVNFYFDKEAKWGKVIREMREIALECGLTEELKWGCPCYTLEGNNIVLIHVFKEYCAYLFFKGAIVKDPKGILVQQTKNVQAARQIRFTNVNEIIKLRSTLKSYIKDAIKIEKAGSKVVLKKTKDFSMPAEFKSSLEKDNKLNKAFHALTPGRQRGYLLFFSAPKNSETREARIEKYKKAILSGKGLNDK